MGGGKIETPCGLGADTGQDSHKAKAGGTWKLAQAKGRAKRARLYEIHPKGDGEPFTIEATGRDAWALEQLVKAGPSGCTPFEQPGPRWSGYVYVLRGLGVPIDTVRETHGGEFAGYHGRYVLRATVRREGGAP
jgi:hypothetical protein